MDHTQQHSSHNIILEFTVCRDAVVMERAQQKEQRYRQLAEDRAKKHQVFPTVLPIVVAPERLYLSGFIGDIKAVGFQRFDLSTPEIRGHRLRQNRVLKGNLVLCEAVRLTSPSLAHPSAACLLSPGASRSARLAVQSLIFECRSQCRISRCQFLREVPEWRMAASGGGDSSESSYARLALWKNFDQ